MHVTYLWYVNCTSHHDRYKIVICEMILQDELVYCIPNCHYYKTLLLIHNA